MPKCLRIPYQATLQLTKFTSRMKAREEINNSLPVFYVFIF